MIEGGCHCGNVRYELAGEPLHHALCHCSDCRRHSGSPMVGWAMYKEDALTLVKGGVKAYSSSENGRRHFCADCGTGLFYYNQVMLPNIVDVQSGTFDDPESIPPQVQIQTAERLSWMTNLNALPEFKGFPPGD